MATIEERAREDFQKTLENIAPSSNQKDVKSDDNWKLYDGEHAILVDPRLKPRTIGKGSEKITVNPTRMILPLHRRIVESSVDFLFGDPARLSSRSEKDDAAADALEALWDRTKLDSFNIKLARDVFVELCAAELWQIEKNSAGENRARVTLLSRKEGYTLRPHFNAFGDMDCFTILFNRNDEEDENKKIDYATIYCNDVIFYGIKTDNEWQVREAINDFGKIPIVLYAVEKEDWFGATKIIDRMELLLSQFAGANDYFGSPILEITGMVDELPEEGSLGRIIHVKPIEGKEGQEAPKGGARFVTWEQAPQSVELEYNLLKDAVFSQTSTPDLSFNNVKGIGTLSGVTLRLMLQDSIMKSRRYQVIFSEGLHRRINLMREVLRLIGKDKVDNIEDAMIDIRWGSVLPTDSAETVTSLSIARSGEKIMSQKTAVNSNPFVENPEEEIREMERERQEEGERSDDGFGGGAQSQSAFRDNRIDQS